MGPIDMKFLVWLVLAMAALVDSPVFTVALLSQKLYNGFTNIPAISRATFVVTPKNQQMKFSSRRAKFSSLRLYNPLEIPNNARNNFNLRNRHGKCHQHFLIGEFSSK